MVRRLTSAVHIEPVPPIQPLQTRHVQSPQFTIDLTGEDEAGPSPPAAGKPGYAQRLHRGVDPWGEPDAAVSSSGATLSAPHATGHALLAPLRQWLPEAGDDEPQPAAGRKHHAPRSDEAVDEPERQPSASSRLAKETAEAGQALLEKADSILEAKEKPSWQDLRSEMLRVSSASAWICLLRWIKGLGITDGVHLATSCDESDGGWAPGIPALAVGRLIPAPADHDRLTRVRSRRNWIA